MAARQVDVEDQPPGGAPAAPGWALGYGAAAEERRLSIVGPSRFNKLVLLSILATVAIASYLGATTEATLACGSEISLLTRAYSQSLNSSNPAANLSNTNTSSIQSECNKASEFVRSNELLLIVAAIGNVAFMVRMQWARRHEPRDLEYYATSMVPIGLLLICNPVRAIAHLATYQATLDTVAQLVAEAYDQSYFGIAVDSNIVLFAVGLGLLYASACLLFIDFRNFKKLPMGAFCRSDAARPSLIRCSIVLVCVTATRIGLGYAFSTDIGVHAIASLISYGDICGNARRQGIQSCSAVPEIQSRQVVIQILASFDMFAQFGLVSWEQYATLRVLRGVPYLQCRSERLATILLSAQWWWCIGVGCVLAVLTVRKQSAQYDYLNAGECCSCLYGLSCRGGYYAPSMSPSDPPMLNLVQTGLSCWNGSYIVLLWISMLGVMVYLLRRVPVPPLSDLDETAVRVAFTDAQVRELLAKEEDEEVTRTNGVGSVLMDLARKVKAAVPGAGDESCDTAAASESGAATANAAPNQAARAQWRSAVASTKRAWVRALPNVLTLETMLLGWYLAYGVYLVKDDPKQPALDDQSEATEPADGATSAAETPATERSSEPVVTEGGPHLGHAAFTTVATLRVPSDASLVCVLETADEIWVTFRGTANAKNALADLKAYTTGDLSPLMPVSADEVAGRSCCSTLRKRRKGGVRIHSGFHGSFGRLSTALLPIIERLGAGGRPVVITGHSLGGALATLCALAVRCRLGLRVSLITFGSPRVGNRVFRSLFSEHIVAAWRCVNAGDPVTSVPAACMGFVHVGTPVLLNDTNGDLVPRPNDFELWYLNKLGRVRHHSMKLCEQTAPSRLCGRAFVSPPSHDRAPRRSQI